jgi:hypothetical protein
MMPLLPVARVFGVVVVLCAALGGCGYSSPTSQAAADCANVTGGANSVGPDYQECIAEHE